MDEASEMRSLERRCDLKGESNRFLDRACASSEALRQVFARNKLHDQRQPAAVLEEVKHLRDTRMIDSSQGAGFAAKSLPMVGFRRRRIPQDFDSDVTIQPRIMGSIHFSHAAGAKQRKDTERANGRADL